MKIKKLIKRIYRSNQIVLAMFFRNLSLYFYHQVKLADEDDEIIEVLTDIMERDGFIHEEFLSPKTVYGPGTNVKNPDMFYKG